ncbi:MAG: glycosyl hydrolase 115 family protein [Mediterranea sp.]|nr:glycosyl hydrolase 115 family protein [Mediterranea sp.]
MKKLLLLSLFLVSMLSSLSAQGVEQFVFNEPTDGYFPLANDGMPANIISDDADKGVQRAVLNLCEDIFKVTGYHSLTYKPNAVVIGTMGQSKLIDRLVAQGKIDGNELRGKTEKYIITTVTGEYINDATNVLVVAGSDKRGTIYGTYEISRQIGVSPWYWWADVPVKRQPNLFVKPGVYTDGEPKVRYRGIFINDEAPAFQGWCVEKFGGVNSKMYEHMFELILRLKGNFLWPAMWGNMFYHDDPKSGELANDMGIVIGTSHHEPMGRAHEEWKVSGSGAWNYQTNTATLDKFWEGGMERMKNYETIVTVGMRGDGDEAMSPTPNLSLLENIVKKQRQIIQKVTGKKPEEVPQAWALYKEVQDYYDQGMRVPDDVTLLFADDNWGNVRKLPDINAKPRKGGYGMYYHFDYVGAPRNYKWLNVTQISRTWEQMNLCYTHGVRQIWVVNVGDLKPMEYPISFFLDMAWDPERFNAQNLEQWNEQWCAAQFGQEFAKETARLMNLYTQYNTRITPELLTANSFSLENYGEFERVLGEYRSLLIDASRIYNLLPADTRDAFDELVLFPINGVCNLYEMYYAVAMNRYYAAKNDLRANAFADKVKECFDRDARLTIHYNKEIADGKWAHMMDQVRIGYRSWNDPRSNIMPQVTYVEGEVPKEKTFVEKDKYISIEAENFAKSVGNAQIRWEVIPWLGRTKSGVTTMPANAYPKEGDNIYIEYAVQTQTDGEADVNVWLAPTLNFNANKGLRYALSVDGGAQTVVNFNGHYKGELGNWQGYRIIKSVTKLNFGAAGKHTLRIRVLEPGIVFEKVMLDFGGLKPTYLGAPESDYIKE